jgi:hypothetical protein
MLAPPAWRTGPKTSFDHRQDHARFQSCGTCAHCFERHGARGSISLEEAIIALRIQAGRENHVMKDRYFSTI